MASRADRFSGRVKPVEKGTAKRRSRLYAAKCGKYSPKIPEGIKQVIRKHRRPSDNDMTAVLRAYTSNDFFAKMNKALYDDNENDLEVFGGLIHAMRLSMKRKCETHNVSKGTVHRFLDLSDAQLKQFKVGFRFLWPNFVSTSWRNDLHFGKVKVSIDLDRRGGTTFALDVSSYSLYPEEQEVLIYPYSGFEVIAVQTQPNGRPWIKLRTMDTLAIDPDVGKCPCGAMPVVEPQGKRKRELSSATSSMEPRPKRFTGSRFQLY